MRRRIRLTERELRNMISESVKRILNESGHIFYNPNGRNDDVDEWNEAGLNIYDFSLVEDKEIADFHFSKEGYIIYYDNEEFGEVWFEKSLGCYRGVSDNDIFNGYTRGFEGMTLDDILEDIMDKAADSILNGDDDDDDY